MRLNFSILFSPVILSLALMAFSFTARAEDYRYGVDILLLESPSSLGIKLGARDLHSRKYFNREASELVATTVLGIYKEPFYDPDTIAWLAKYLGATGDAHYKALLEKLAAGTVHKSAMRHINAAIKNLDGEMTLQYVKGAKSIYPGEDHAEKVLAGLREKYKGNNQDDIFAIEGDSLGTIIDKLGFPAAASSDIIVRDVTRFGKRKMQQLLLKYKEHGLVRLTKLNGDWVYIDSIPYPTITGDFPNQFIRDYSNATNMQYLDELWSWDVYQLKRIVHGTADLKLSEAKLDLIAQRVWVGRNDRDPFVVDALAHLCKTLARSANPRYALILDKTSELALERKLRKHAGKSARRLAKWGRGKEFESLEPL